jgi:hypothetical protein
VTNPKYPNLVPLEQQSQALLFPSVRNRLRQVIPIFPEFTTMVTGHGKLRSYLHRFGLTDNPKCPCEEEEEETTNHLLFHSKKLRNQRNEMTKQIKKRHLCQLAYDE